MDLGDRKILIIDDDPSIIQLLTRFLSSKGYSSVTGASTVKEGLEKVSRESPQLLLLDYHLPDGTGLDLLRDLKPSSPEMGVIIITGEGDDEVGREALKLGAFDYIQKPFDLDYLERVLWWQLRTLSWED